MKISGFTFVRNSLVFGYPLYESIHSLLPLCDELIVAAGKSDDDTIPFLNNILNSKIKIIETEWDHNLHKAGMVYSQQTNIALNACSGDWCIYLQADEVLHEEDYDMLIDEIKSVDLNPNIDGLLFRYLHFYGSYDYIGAGRQWYRREIRAFRNTGNIVSWGDAQGFRKKTNLKFDKLRARQTAVRVFHYGWVKPPEVQKIKFSMTQTYYHDDVEININEAKKLGSFDYSSAYELEKFNGKHPEIMNNRLQKDKYWADLFDPLRLKKKPLLMNLSDILEKASGWRIGEFKDFIEVK